MPTYQADEFDEDALQHYGILRKSGRYPWGSGGDDSASGRSTRAKTFMEMVADLENQGLSKPEVARGLGMTTTQLRDTVTIANNAIKRDKQLTAEKLREKGWSATAIGKKMGLNESSVRDLLNPQVQERALILENTVNRLRDEVDKGGWVGIGAGSEYYVGGGISKEKLRAAVAVLKDEGYVQIEVQVDQGGTRNKTTVKTLCPPGTTYKDVVTSKELIRELVIVSEDGGRTTLGIQPPLQVNPKRVGVLYKEDGGAKSDGVVYVRPGVEDVSIGGSKYAQVRIDVGGTHYIKGMAMYKNDLPEGIDLLVSSNKPKGTPMMGEKNNTVLKNQTEDKDNPFGAVISRQITVKDKNGNDKVTSAMNILQEEGDWDKWSRTLSSQVLSKQSPKTAEVQLKKTYDKSKQDLDEIMALTNPTVRAHLLNKFSDSADSDAVHLSAAGLPRASYHAILPFNSLKDNEVYAPNFDQGERVALIRYPHGGTFEIPELTVNNNARAPKAAIGRAKDAIGINHKVAERLSGADFDGDFVMVVPNDSNHIKSTPALKQLQGFDPQRYKLPAEAPKMTPKQKGLEMGNVSNLITDMTIQKASMDEISRAVKHSMVVIDAEKHHLDYKRSAQDHGIAALKEKYQGLNPKTGQPNGASTLISRATSPTRINARKPRSAAPKKDPVTGQPIPGTGGGRIDRATGKLMYTDTGEHYITKTGKTVFKKDEIAKLALTDDARTLLSRNGGTLIEKVYAEHSNRLKALANQARKEMVNSADSVPTSASAKKVFKDDVDQLKADLHVALRNSPRERQAQVLQNAIVAQKRAEQPGMDNATLKKVRAQALAEARTRAGAKKVLVPISDRQWEAIQAGAVSKSMLKKILDNSDIERIKELATPRHQTIMGSAESARARSLINQGLTQAEAARVLGVSLTTLKKGLG